MLKFENERQSGIKCVNVHCQFCMDDPDIICDSVNGKDGDPSYVDCLTYLPEKLIDNIESPNPAESKEKLLPCPFCGGKAIMMIAVPFNGHRIECEHHCCLQTFSSRDMAVYRWNRRAKIKE